MCAAARRRGREFVLSATVDFPGDLMWGVYTAELLDEMVGRLKSVGVTRIYWLYYGDVDRDSFWAGTFFNDRPVKYGPQTLANLGEPLKAAVPIAHKHGVELYGVLKPYNTGYSGTYPEGAPEPRSTEVKRIGGTVDVAVPFVERHPHTRIRRRDYEAPPGLQETRVKRIRLVKADDSPTRVRKQDLQIWASADNYRYTRRNVDFIVSDMVAPAVGEVRDYYGRVVTPKGAPVRSLTLDGLDLADKYILVTTDFKDQNGDFRNTANAMVEAYGERTDPLPIVVATRSANRRWDRDFRTDGLEFDSGFGPLQVYLDVDNEASRGGYWWTSMPSHGAIAFARGKNERLSTAPCEVYPEVRELWEGWIDRILQAGVDGIDLRISAHGSHTDEPAEYGFNEPVLREYDRRSGKSARDRGPDLQQLAHIRGEHYTAFIRETSERVRAAGKSMHAHVHTEAFRPEPSHGQAMGFPPNIHFDWSAWLEEGLVDGITLRTTWFEGMEFALEEEAGRSSLPQALKDPFVEEVLATTQRKNLPVQLNRYVSRAVNIDEYLADLELAFNDERFSGFDIYEVLHCIRPTPDGSRLVPVEDRLERIGAKASELGIL